MSEILDQSNLVEGLGRHLRFTPRLSYNDQRLIITAEACVPISFGPREIGILQRVFGEEIRIPAWENWKEVNPGCETCGYGSLSILS